MQQIQESQKIKEGEGDSAEFIGIVNKIMEAIVSRFSVKEVVHVKIKNWFDHKWLNYSGKTVIPFAGFRVDAALKSVWRTKISIPPFNPNRVLSSMFFILEETGNHKISNSIHKHQMSNENIHNRIIDYTSDGLVIWFSSNSEPLQKGSMMAYRVQNEEVITWYASIGNTNGWRIIRAKGISLDELKEYVE